MNFKIGAFFTYTVLVWCSFRISEVFTAKLDDFVNADVLGGEKRSICHTHDVNTYVRRYVNTFLRYSKLSERDLQNDLRDNDVIHANLKLRLTVRQLRILQRIHNEKNYVPSLEDLDRIFSSIMYQSSTDNIAANLGWMISFLTWSYRSLDVSFPQLISFTITIWFLLNWYFRGLTKPLVFKGVAALILVDGFKKYLYALREANIKFYLEMKDQQQLSDECDPSNWGFLSSAWINVKNKFREDPCVQTYMHSTAHYAENVSLVHCLIEPFLVVISLFMKYIGVWTKEISMGITGTGWFGQLLSAVVYPIALVTVVGSLLYMFSSANINISTYLASVRLSHNNSAQPSLAEREPTSPPHVDTYLQEIHRMLIGLTLRTIRRRNTPRKLTSSARFPMRPEPEHDEPLEITNNRTEPQTDRIEPSEEVELFEDAVACQDEHDLTPCPLNILMQQIE